MKRWTTWSVVAAMLALSAGLGACKSRARSRVNTCAAPTCAAPTCVTPGYGTSASPGIAAVPQQPYAPGAYDTPAGDPNQFDATGYPPAPPELTTAPIPSARQAELDLARADAVDAQRRSDDLRLQLDAERIANREAMEDLERRMAALPPTGQVPTAPGFSGVSADAAAKLMDDLRSNNVADVSREGDLVIVRYTNSFKAGSDKLRRDAQIISTLNATAEALNRCHGASVAVVGHSDGDPIRKSNWPSNDALSMARAQRVAQVLSDNGVDQNRISIDGRGFRDPLVSPEVGRADKARNRRVEILIRL